MTAAARKMRAYMRRHRLNESGLARELGVNSSTITRWITGETEPAPTVQHRINRCFGIINEWVE